MSHSHLVTHLTALSDQNKAIKVRLHDKASKRYWPISIELILDYAEKHDLGDTDRIKENADQKIDKSITDKIVNSKNYIR